MPVEQLPRHHRPRELIDARIDRIAGQLLGREVRGRAGDRAGRGQVRIASTASTRSGSTAVLDAREPEVGDDRAAVARDEHVLRLDVAMDDAGGVRGGEPSAAPSSTSSSSSRVRAIAGPLAQRHAVDQLHRDPDLVALGADVVDVADVRMRQPGERSALRGRAARGSACRRRRWRTTLIATGARELRILRAIDDAHAARAEHGVDPVAAEARRRTTARQRSTARARHSAQPSMCCLDRGRLVVGELAGGEAERAGRPAGRRHHRRIRIREIESSMSLSRNRSRLSSRLCAHAERARSASCACACRDRRAHRRASARRSRDARGTGARGRRSSARRGCAGAAGCAGGPRARANASRIAFLSSAVYCARRCLPRGSGRRVGPVIEQDLVERLLAIELARSSLSALRVAVTRSHAASSPRPA